MINDKINPVGELHIVLRGPDGKIKEEKTVPNVVVTTGKYLLAQRAANVVGTPALSGGTAAPSHMSVGTNNTLSGDASVTTLLAEGSRVAMATPTVSNNVVTYSATFGPGAGTGALVEAGIFNGATAGAGNSTMLCRTVFSVVNKGALDTLTINWNLTIS